MGCKLQLRMMSGREAAAVANWRRSAAQGREGRGGESGRISGVIIDKGRCKCGLKDGLLFGDGVVVYGQGFGLRIAPRERALFAGQTHADAAFSSRDAKNRDLNSLQLRSVCISTHPVFFCCVLFVT